MKKFRILSICMAIAFGVSLTGCTNIKTNTINSTTNDSKEISSTSETSTLTKEDVEDKTEEIQLRLENFMDNYNPDEKFNGTILVAKGEQVLFEKGYGMADYDKNVANTPKTIFGIGSVTKQFTATAILMLKEKGLLSVQDTVDKYMPDYPNGNKISIYNLLNHTSGIPEYLYYVNEDQATPGKHTYTSKELIGIFRSKPLDFETGTEFRYSNSNYILLGYIIEKVTGTSYEDYIKNNILIPLKMHNTMTSSDMDMIKDLAVGYSEISSKGTTKAFVWEPSLPYAAGEIYSNAEDLLIWNNYLCSSKLISESSLKEMFTPYMGNYGYGWFVEEKNGNKRVYHGGNIPGFSANIQRDINKGYVAIVLSNKNKDISAQFIGELLLKLVADE